MGSRVQDWMTREPVRVREHVSALEALDRMVEHGIRHLPVVAGARERVIGIVTLDDLRGAFPFDVSLKHPLGAIERMEVRDYRVCEVMTWAPQTVHANVSLEQAVRTLAEHRIGCLPVVDDRERLVGVFSETDALHAFDAVLRGDGVPVESAREPDTVVDTLWAERGRIAEQLATWQHADRLRSADRADEERDVALLEVISTGAAQRLRAIDNALALAEHGRLGICERCQGRIPATRLRAIPETTLCVRCARTTAGRQPVSA